MFSEREKAGFSLGYLVGVGNTILTLGVYTLLSQWMYITPM